MALRILWRELKHTGEAYDKTARLLGLELNPSGGAALEVFAREGDPESYAFKEPMLSHRDCNLSYAGLKTSVRIAIERDVVGEPSEANRQVQAATSVHLTFLDRFRMRRIRSQAVDMLTFDR